MASKAKTKGEVKTELQIAELDAAIRRKGWTAGMARVFAKRWGCNPPRVYEIKRRVIDRMTQDDDVTLEDRRALFLAELRDVRNEARQARAWGSVAGMMKMEAQILGLFAPVELRIDASPMAAMTDSELEAILVNETRMAKEKNGTVFEADFTVVNNGG